MRTNPRRRRRSMDGGAGAYREAILTTPACGLGACHIGDLPFEERVDEYLLFLNQRAGPDSSGPPTNMTRMLDELDRHADRGPGERSALPGDARALRDGDTGARSTFAASCSSPTRSRRARICGPSARPTPGRSSSSTARARSAFSSWKARTGGCTTAPFTTHVELLPARVPTPGAKDVALVRRDHARPRRHAARALRRRRSRAGRRARGRAGGRRVPPLASVEGRDGDALAAARRRARHRRGDRSRARGRSTGSRLWQVNQRTPDGGRASTSWPRATRRARWTRRAPPRAAPRRVCASRCARDGDPRRAERQVPRRAAPLPARPRAHASRGQSARHEQRRPKRHRFALAAPRAPGVPDARARARRAAARLPRQRVDDAQAARGHRRRRRLLRALAPPTCTAASTRSARRPRSSTTPRASRRQGSSARAPDEIVFVRGTTEAINLRGATRSSSARTTRSSSRRASTTPTGCRGACAREPVPMAIDADGVPRWETLEVASSRPGRGSSPSATSPTSPAAIAPVEEVVRVAHARGVPVLLDAAQSLSHLPIDVTKLDVDFLAASSHKAFGPSGVGILYAKRERLAGASRSTRWAAAWWPSTRTSRRRAEPFVPRDVPFRFEAGTPAIEATIGFGAAVRWMRAIGMEAHPRPRRAPGALSGRRALARAPRRPRARGRRACRAAHRPRHLRGRRPGDDARRTSRARSATCSASASRAASTARTSFTRGRSSTGRCGRARTSSTRAAEIDRLVEGVREIAS